MNELQIMAAYERKVYNGQPVVTLKDIDRLHRRPEGTAKRNFLKNREHFLEGIDYYLVKDKDVQKDEFRTFEIGKRGTLLFTQTGYLMIVKSFTDDLSWMIQRELVTGYFAARRELMFMGTPVMLLTMAAEALGTNAGTLRDRVKRMARDGRFTMADGMMLEGRNLARFKADNGLRMSCKAIWVITAQGFGKIRN